VPVQPHTHSHKKHQKQNSQHRPTRLKTDSREETDGVQILRQAKIALTSLSAADVLHLQRSVGNDATRNLLQRSQNQRGRAHNGIAVTRAPGTTPSIQRIGDPTQLRGLDTKKYGTERTEQRNDLVDVVKKYAEIIGPIYEIIEEIKPLDPADDTSLDDAKIKLRWRLPVGDNDVIYGIIENMTKDQTLQRLTRIYDRQLEKARLQDIAIDDQGNLDMAALNARMVSYDETPEAQGKTQVTIQGGKLKRSATYDPPNADVDTSNSVTQHSGKGWEVFVTSPGGEIHMASHKIGKYHHSSLLAGQPVAMAGEMKVLGGTINIMSNKSGHYTPGPEHFQHFLRTIEKAGIALTFTVKGWGVAEGTAQDWMNSLGEEEQPEVADISTLVEYYREQGHDWHTYLTAELGWRDDPNSFNMEKEEGGIWKRVSYDEWRTALENKFGKAKRKMTSGKELNITWL